MNRTQRVIVLTGIDLERVLTEVKGFKAISIVRRLTPAAVENVKRHNKNVVFATASIDTTILEYRPIIIRCINGKSSIEKMQLNVNNVIEDFPILLDSINIDTGDHASFDSTNAEKECNCFICNVVNGKPDKHERIIYESRSFVALPGTGAFFDGYLMIVPKKHIMSFAELNPEEYEEFLQVLNDIRFILECVYKKKIFVFECGTGHDGSGKHKTSIVHAHIHLAPSDIPVLDKVHESGLYPAQIDPRDLIKNYGKYPYMLYIDQEDNWYITSDPETYFPRQHPRQILADYMCLPKGYYNWRNFPMREKIDMIADVVQAYLRANFNELPAWIRDNVRKFLF